MAGKCPHCEKMLSSVNLKNISVNGSRSWHGVAYVCPWCSTVLNVEIDPLAVQSDTIATLQREVERLTQTILQQIQNLGRHYCVSIEKSARPFIPSVNIQ